MVAFAAIALFAVACGSEDKDAAAGDSGAPSGPEATVRGTGATGPAVPAATSGPSGGNLQSSSLNSLSSYRYTVTMEGTGGIADSLGLSDITGSGGDDSFKYSIAGAWIAPDKAQLEMDFAGQAIKQTIIGNQQWITFAGVPQGPIAADTRAVDLTLAASLIDQGTLDAALAEFDCDTTEEVNGIRTKKCDGDLEDLNRNRDEFSGAFGDSSVIEATAYDASIWIAEQGNYPVKAGIHMAGKTTDGEDFTLALTLDVTDIGQVAEIRP